VFQYVYVFVFADVSTLTENDERSTIGIKLSWLILRFCGGDFVGGLKILFSADSGFVCIPFYICCVFFMMVWYGAFRSLVYSMRIPHISARMLNIHLYFGCFWRDTVW
jgi:hypothetical protein